MIGQNQQLFVFYKNDAKSGTSEIIRDFDVLSIKQPEKIKVKLRDGSGSEEKYPKVLWVNDDYDELDSDEEMDYSQTTQCQKAGCIQVNRTDYLLCGGEAIEGGARSDQMHFVNLEMRLAVKLSDKLKAPMSPCYMVKDGETIYIIGGVSAEDSNKPYKDMFGQIQIRMQGAFPVSEINKTSTMINFLKQNNIPHDLKHHSVV